MELNQLQECFARARKNSGACVLVTGRSGIGKSSFLALAARRLADDGALVLEARCHLTAPSLRPLLDIAKQALSHLGRTGSYHSEVESSQALIDTLSCCTPLPRGTATIDDSRESPASRRLQLHERMADLLRAVGAVQPVVVLLHDLHLADEATLQQWTYLCRVLTGVPEMSWEQGLRGLLVASATTGSAATADELWNRGQHLVRVDLRGLDTEGVRAFLSSTEVVERVIESTNGDPHLLRQLVEPGMDSDLDDTDRQVLQMLAVFGRPVGVETLGRLVGREGPVLRESMSRLGQRGSIQTLVVEGDLRIGFSQAGQQRSIYESLDDELRRSLHARIGDHLASQGEAELEATAEHLLRANAGQGAIQAALAAGRRLEATLCPERAAQLYEQALAAADETDVADVTDTRQRLKLRLCRVLADAGKPELALLHARSLQHDCPDDAEAALRVADLLLVKGDIPSVRDVLRPFAPCPHDSRTLPDELTSRILATMAWAEFLGGEADLALTLGQRALECLPDEAAVEAQRIGIQNTLGKIHLEQEAYQLAEKLFVDNLQRARQAAMLEERVRAKVQMGQCHLQQGDLVGAERWYAQALQLARSTHKHRYLGACLQHLGVLAERRGRYGQALELYQESVTVWKQVGHRAALAWVSLDLGHLYWRLGAIRRAEAMVELGQRLTDAEPPLAIRINLHLLLGRIAWSEGKLPQAAELIGQARKWARDAGQPEREIRCRLDLVQLNLDRDRYEEAAALLQGLDPACTQRIQLQVELAWAQIDSQAGRRADARRRLMELIQSPGAELDRESLWQAHHLLSVLARQEGRSAEARRLLDEAIRIERALYEDLPEDLARSLWEQPRRAVLHEAEDQLDNPTGQTADADRVAAHKSRDCGIVGEHPGMQQLMQQVDRVARTDALVMIRGESGTGKELIAEALHRLGPRCRRPLIKVNCAALVDTLLLSELFGHERGAFTGAVSRKKGRFELAHGGTLFLDEIGDISASTQVALLRVLECGEFERVGGTTPIRVDVRIICATNRNLESMVAEGTFRQDLYYRLRGVQLTVPPLRERVEDIALLANHFLERIAVERGCRIKQLTPPALQVLCAHRWPGNVRELDNMLRSVSLLIDEEWIDEQDFVNLAGLPPLGPTPPPQPGNDADTAPGNLAYTCIRGQGLSLKSLKKQIEAHCIEAALGETGGNITRAAALLGMKRPRLSQLIKEHQIAVNGDRVGVS